METSAGGVVVRTIEGVPHALLIRDPHGRWGLPKGRAEEGEAIWQTALREVREETGLVDVQLGPELVTIDWVFRVAGRRIHKYATFYLMYSERGDPEPAREEGITLCEWVELGRADERISYQNATEVVRLAQVLVLEDGRAEVEGVGPSNERGTR